MKFKIEAICISSQRGVQKISVGEAMLVDNYGFKGDAHAGDWHRQVSFLAAEDIEEMEKKGLTLKPGAFGENIVTRGIDWTQVTCGGKIFIGEAELEVTQIGKECHTPCAIYHSVGYCIMPERGVFARVIKGGRINVGDIGYYRF
ncbi:MAG: MOSC domain-containing protein [Candidatus Aminicenantes bacterium]|nr:MAG: MOSC domain-containing protein [Candidatus Aminicenantes bacterium]